MSAFIINPYIFGVPEKFWVPTQSSLPINLTSFRVITSGGTATTAIWGDGTTQVLTSNVSVNKTFNTSSSGIDLNPQVPIINISCGASSPALGGAINLSKFLGLTTFTCNNNAITSISGFESNSGLLSFNYARNSVTGNIPNLSSLTAITGFFCFFNLLTGSIPSLSANTQLQSFYCDRNQLTGSIPNLSSNTQLRDFRCYSNQLTGNIPNLSSNGLVTTFYCYTNQLTGFAGGSVSATLGDFQAHNNNLTSEAVNAILAAFMEAGRTSASGTCNLRLEGVNNGAPTGQGITDKATLQSRGWTVITS